MLLRRSVIHNICILFNGTRREIFHCENANVRNVFPSELSEGGMKNVTLYDLVNFLLFPLFPLSNLATLFENEYT